MLTWYAAGLVAAIAVAWLAAMLHASGHAPVGLVSIGVGTALGVALGTISRDATTSHGREDSSSAR